MKKSDATVVVGLFASFMGISGSLCMGSLDQQIVSVCPLCPSTTAYLVMKCLAYVSWMLPVVGLGLLLRKRVLKKETTEG